MKRGRMGILYTIGSNIDLERPKRTKCAAIAKAASIDIEMVAVMKLAIGMSGEVWSLGLVNAYRMSIKYL